MTQSPPKPQSSQPSSSLSAPTKPKSVPQPMSSQTGLSKKDKLLATMFKGVSLKSWLFPGHMMMQKKEGSSSHRCLFCSSFLQELKGTSTACGLDTSPDGTWLGRTMLGLLMYSSLHSFHWTCIYLSHLCQSHHLPEWLLRSSVFCSTCWTSESWSL